jgi:hypothetical protein
MIVRITQNGASVPPTQVWAGLTTECQARVIQFLARLASKLVTQESVPTPRRSADDEPVLCLEDPA